MLQFPLYISLLVGTVSLAQGYLEAGQFQTARWILLVGLAWAFAQFRRWRWFAPLGLFAALTCAGYGLWIDLSLPWMLAGALGTLFAWDLSDFMRRLEVSAPQNSFELTQRHLIRLVLLSALGLAYSILRMIYWWELYADSLVFVAMLSVLGVSLLVGRMRQGRS